jgi:hypothetical protein
VTDHPARLRLLRQLERAAIDAYGEERVADSSVRAELEAAATALWRVVSQPLEPHDVEPFHD